MDGLALLCNLHADGPLSLRRLRNAGVRTLEEVTAVPEDSLGAILKASPGLARRLVYEARQLAARLDEMPLEPETGAPREPVIPAPRAASPPAVPLPVEASAAPAAVEPTLPFVRSPALEAYDLHADEPDLHGETSVVEPLTVAEEGLLSAPLGEPGWRALAEPDSPGLPEPTGQPEPEEPIEGSVLRRDELPGLDRRILESLVREGVRTYRSLADLVGLSLARRTGIPYPRLLDLGLAAGAHLRRRLSAAPAPAAAAEATPVAPVAPATGEVVPDEELRIVEVTPPAPRSQTGSYRPGPVLEGTRLIGSGGQAPEEDPPDPEKPFFPVATGTPGAPEVLEDPGVAGPFV